MNQDQLLAQRDGLAQAYHLGELELYCTPMTAKEWWTILAVTTLVSSLATMPFLFVATLLMYHSLSPGIALLSMVIPTAAPIFVVFCFIVYVIYSRTDQTSVYVYTSGLVCLRRGEGRVVHWEEIRKVWIQGDETLVAELNDATRIRFPFLPSRGSARNNALQKFIEEKMAQARMERDQ